MLLMANRNFPHPEEAAQRPSRRAQDADPAPTDVAEAVRVFYDSHPYPPPISNLDRHRELYRNPDRRRALSLLLWPTEQLRANREILVAGCGTSQAAIHALREPEARVTAIDISETSLRYTRDLQRKYRLQNLDLHRMAIEQVGELCQLFDQIVCTGVLHHLPDADLGLRSLRNVLAPSGAMHLMVYAAYGRAGIYMMQEYCRLLGVGASQEELRDLGAMIGALSSDHPIAGVSRRAKDFRNPDALADALLHPQDRAYIVVVRKQRTDRGAEVPQLLLRGADPKTGDNGDLALLRHRSLPYFRRSATPRFIIAQRPPPARARERSGHRGARRSRSAAPPARSTRFGDWRRCRHRCRRENTRKTINDPANRGRSETSRLRRTPAAGQIYRAGRCG